MLDPFPDFPWSSLSYAVAGMMIGVSCYSLFGECQIATCAVSIFSFFLLVDQHVQRFQAMSLYQRELLQLTQDKNIINHSFHNPCRRSGGQALARRDGDTQKSLS